MTASIDTDRGRARAVPRRRAGAVLAVWLWLAAAPFAPGVSIAAAVAAEAAAEPGGTQTPAAESTVAEAAPGETADAPAHEPAPEHPVKVWNRTVATLATGYQGASPATRARNASQRLDAWLADDSAGDPVATWVTIDGRSGVLIATGGHVLFGLLPEDVGRGEPATEAETRLAGERVIAALARVREERRELDEPSRQVQAIVLALAITAFWIGLWALGSRLYHRLRARLHERAAVRAEVLRKGGYDFRPLLFGVIERLAGAAWIVVWLVLTYLWLGFLLKLFPYTRPWGVTLGGYVRDAASRLLAGFVEEIPSLLTLVLIWLVTHAISRVVRDWFSAIRAGVIEVDWCDPTAAVVSSRLAQIALWLFALTIAYPYIPGSDTPAFKGLSVLFGLMVSIGSAGMIGQIVSGIVAVYTKAIRIGDLVRIGDVEGTVTSMGVLSLKVANRFHEEFTIPNAMLAGTPVHNFSRLSAEKGLVLATSVTIGYDAPWRQIHAMLLLAAARTPEVLREPPPQVLQKALSDFYVEYTLLVSIAVPTRRPFVLSVLHANIQDAFNEYGVQIMSPNFEAQPDHKIWVPRERWHEAPASADPAPGPSDAIGRAAAGPGPGTP